MITFREQHPEFKLIQIPDSEIFYAMQLLRSTRTAQKKNFLPTNSSNDSLIILKVKLYPFKKEHSL